ncbi:unnamed protein product, partial [Mesorhabditis spiculigera]
MVKNILLLFAVGFTVSAELSCEDGWTLGQGTEKCYKSLPGLMKYDASKAACDALGAGLPVIHSEAENAAVYAFTRDGEHVRLGATRFGSGKYDFKWTDGSEMDYKRFNDEYMDNALNLENCFDMWPEDRWNDNKCYVPEIVVCQKPASNDGGTPDPNAPSKDPNQGPNGGFILLALIPLGVDAKLIPKTGCTANWTRGIEAGSCFLVILDMRVEDAKAECAEMGATLASIHSDSENQLILDMVRKAVPTAQESTWRPTALLGGHRTANDNKTFHWDDKTKMDYKNMQPDEPNQQGDEGCLEMFLRPFKTLQDYG